MSELPPLPDIPAAARFVAPLLARGKELELADPVVSYYCKLHAAQQILARDLHKSDPATAEFVGDLLDQVEFMKANSPKLTSEYGQSILNDDTVASAYVESFAMNVFAKADKDVYDKTTSKATITKFMAAAAFFDLLNVFQVDDFAAAEDAEAVGEQETQGLDKDIKEKIKYCKWQAARIAKDYKKGNDPNTYDPPEPKADEQQQIDDLLSETIKDVEAEANTQSGASHDSAADPQEDEKADADDINPEDFFIPPPSTIPTTQHSATASGPAGPDVAPATYTPSPPTFPPSANPLSSIPVYVPPPPASSAFSHAAPNGSEKHASSLSRQQVQSILDESELITTVQKHCKFAISALTYEDMKTALKELDTARDLLLKNVPEKDLY